MLGFKDGKLKSQLAEILSEATDQTEDKTYGVKR